jgi:malate dehydrogenase
VSAYLEGEYDLNGVFMGVPVILGRNGVERIMEIELSYKEREALAKSAADVRQGISDWEKINREKIRSQIVVET